MSEAGSKKRQRDENQIKEEPQSPLMKRQKTVIIATTEPDFTVVIMDREYMVSKYLLKFYCDYFSTILKNDCKDSTDTNSVTVPFIIEPETTIQTFFDLLHDPFHTLHQEFSLEELLRLHTTATYFGCVKIITWSSEKVRAYRHLVTYSSIKACFKFLGQFNVKTIMKEPMMKHLCHMIVQTMFTMTMTLSVADFEALVTPDLSRHLLHQILGTHHRWERYSCCLD